MISFSMMFRVAKGNPLISKESKELLLACIAAGKSFRVFPENTAPAAILGSREPGSNTVLIPPADFRAILPPGAEERPRITGGPIPEGLLGAYT